jgi:hypothetical protein
MLITSQFTLPIRLRQSSHTVRAAYPSLPANDTARALVRFHNPVTLTPGNLL